jgi:hypothetical protein
MNEDWSRTTRYLTLIIVFTVLALLLFAIRALIGPKSSQGAESNYLKPGLDSGD